jgi:NAD(P)-dependent dehydrogenase (short-subunit alcohol dehydrogenase family)
VDRRGKIIDTTLALARGLALELAPTGINVNPRAQGLISSEANAHMQGGAGTLQTFHRVALVARLAVSSLHPMPILS